MRFQLYFKLVTNFISDLSVEIPVENLRVAALKNNCIFLGYIISNTKHILLNPKLDSKIKFNNGDKLLVFSED